MKVSAEFVLGVASQSQLPKDRIPQIALCGRSNVGKSSLINALLGTKGLAKTSSTPGKTRQLNFFRVKQEGRFAAVKEFYFVDLPGYGYAKVSQKERESWRLLIEKYFDSVETLRAAVSIIDSRIGPTESDFELLEWLASLQIPVILIATKCDKLSNNRRAVMQQRIKAKVSHLPIAHFMMFSAQNGTGRQQVWQFINELLK